MVETALLQDVLVAAALGALVGMERERVPANKYAGLRTLSLLCAAGPISVSIGNMAGSVIPVAIYVLLGAAFALLIIYIRLQLEGEDLGLTTSTTVFLMTLVGVLVGYSRYFAAVSVTLIAAFLLVEKNAFDRYLTLLSEKELSDAVKLGILALVLYPVLPAGAVDPYGVLFLRKALLFVIFILLVQFAAYVSLQWLENRISFVAAALLGGVASSLAVIGAMTEYVRDGTMENAAYAAASASTVGMVARNLAVAAVLAPAVIGTLALPLGLAVAMGLLFVLVYYRESTGTDGTDFASRSPFSFRAAFEFGLLFLAVLLVTELAVTRFASAGIYATAFLGGIGSSMAVVASAATLLGANTITAGEAATMISLSIVASLLSKLAYTELAKARPLTLNLVPPYLFMALSALAVFL